MSTVNCPWKSVSPNMCAWGKGFNHFSAVVRCEVVFVVVIIWFSGLECSPYAFVPLSTTYHPHSLWKGIASTRTPGQRPSILSHKPDGDMSIQKAPLSPPYPRNTLSLGAFSIRPLGSNLYLQQLIYAPTILAPLFKLYASSSRFGFLMNRYWICSQHTWIDS